MSRCKNRVALVMLATLLTLSLTACGGNFTNDDRTNATMPSVSDTVRMHKAKTKQNTTKLKKKGIELHRIKTVYVIRIAEALPDATWIAVEVEE